MKKPKLKLVGATKANPFAPPASLGKAGAAQWQTIMVEYEISDAGGIAILEQICAATDNLHDCDVSIARHGSIIKTRNGVREHPLLKQRLALRGFICRSMTRLGLNLEAVKTPGRPPTKVGPSPSDYEDYEDED
jgi:terminase small subunit-like protein